MTAVFADEVLRVEGLTVDIPAREGVVRAVGGVSFTVERGKTLAIVGESGAGKSMVCRALMGIVPPGTVVGGRMVFAGRPLAVSGKGLHTVRGGGVGIVLQDPMSSLNPVMRVGAQIAETVRQHRRCSWRQARERAVELLEAVGMPQPHERAASYPHQLSGGMRQRVAVAIALAGDPRLIVADEPTTALDVTVQAEILNLLGKLQRERHVGLLLVTHDLGVVAGRADRTAVMYAGRIVEEGPTAALYDGMRMPYTRALFEAMPKVDGPPGVDLAVIGGETSDQAVITGGCSFAPRCLRARERCLAERPSLVAGEGGEHRWACWFPCGEEVAR